MLDPVGFEGAWILSSSGSFGTLPRERNIQSIRGDAPRTPVIPRFVHILRPAK
jgi:hypothetical protein